MWSRKPHGLTSSRQAVSQHLEVLQAAGLVIAIKQGRYKFHFIDTAPLCAVTDRWPHRGRAGTLMAVPQACGTLETIDDRPALRFERSLGYPIERVWRAVSTPSELKRFFPGPQTTQAVSSSCLSPQLIRRCRPYREAPAADGIPAAQFLVDDVQAEYERLRDLDVEFAQGRPRWVPL